MSHGRGRLLACTSELHSQIRLERLYKCIAVLLSCTTSCLTVYIKATPDSPLLYLTLTSRKPWQL